MTRILNNDDILELYDKATSQMTEDRKALDDVYQDLKSCINGETVHYVDLGEVLTKVVELKIKQTSQLLESIKIIHKYVNENDDELTPFSDEELEEIDKEIKNKDVPSE